MRSFNLFLIYSILLIYPFSSGSFELVDLTIQDAEDSGITDKEYNEITATIRRFKAKDLSKKKTQEELAAEIFSNLTKKGLTIKEGSEAKMSTENALQDSGVEAERVLTLIQQHQNTFNQIKEHIKAGNIKAAQASILKISGRDIHIEEKLKQAMMEQLKRDAEFSQKGAEWMKSYSALTPTENKGMPASCTAMTELLNEIKKGAAAGPSLESLADSFFNELQTCNNPENREKKKQALGKDFNTEQLVCDDIIDGITVWLNFSKKFSESQNAEKQKLADLGFKMANQIGTQQPENMENVNCKGQGTIGDILEKKRQEIPAFADYLNRSADPALNLAKPEDKRSIAGGLNGFEASGVSISTDAACDAKIIKEANEAILNPKAPQSAMGNCNQNLSYSFQKRGNGFELIVYDAKTNRKEYFLDPASKNLKERQSSSGRR